LVAKSFEFSFEVACCYSARNSTEENCHINGTCTAGQLMIAVTGASGKTGRAHLRALAARGEATLEDVHLAQVEARVAARVLTETGHTGAIYELVGTLPLSQLDVAERWATQWGQAVRAEELPLAMWKEKAHQSGLDDYAVQTLCQMFHYYAAYGLVGNPNVLRWLLGRAPTELATFLRGILDRSYAVDSMNKLKA
jgi:hypothetical protein